MQNNASLETYEENYNDMVDYSEHVFHQLPARRASQPQKPLAKHHFVGGEWVGNAFDSIKLEFLQQGIEKVENPGHTPTKEGTLVLWTRYHLYDSDVRKLYNVLKSNINRFQHLDEGLTRSEISIIIDRLIQYGGSLNKRLKFMVKNQKMLGEGVREELKRLNDTSKAVYYSNKAIFNGLFQKVKLTLSDCEKIAGYYYDSKHMNKTIDFIAQVENLVGQREGFECLSNRLWYMKLDILSKTNVNFWNLYGEPLFKTKRALNINSTYTYPHHINNFQILMKRYESDKTKFHLADSIAIIDIVIKGLGKHCDMPSLDKLVESYWGIKVDRVSGKGVYLHEHFKISSNVSELIWPNEEILISILLAYSKNGDIATAIKVNNLLLTYYNTNSAIFDPSKSTKYWELALRCVAIFGNAVDKSIAREMQNESLAENSLLDIKYRFFDRVWHMAEHYLKSNITRDLILLKIKYASAHELLNFLPQAQSKIESNTYNKSNINLHMNQITLTSYVRKCCEELASRGRFLDANELIDKFISSKQETEEFKAMLAEMQEVYARERVKKDEMKRHDIDDDDDFNLW